jgi:(1->4)-alpha-D-glucan 1-alpha-D-glucosylmutase
MAEHVVAFARAGAVVAVAPRLVLGLLRAGGFGDTALSLPRGSFRDVLSGRIHRGGRARVADLLAAFPVALLEGVDA